MNALQFRSRIFINKVLKWEFWPFWFFYIPVYFYWIFLGIKARGFIFFSVANPRMEMGGFIGATKFDILQSLDPQFTPKTILVSPRIELSSILDKMEEAGIDFPLIAKPNIGERGYRVEKINHQEELKEYFNGSFEETLIQEYINYPLEFGIMYYRYPGEEKGHISSVTQKKLLGITGDGHSTILQLVKRSPRAKYHYDHLKKMYSGDRNIILDEGQHFTLVPIGNHCRGATFYNLNRLITPKLEATLNKIGNQLEDFHFGRFDMCTTSIEDMEQGSNIKIFEVNGANSEPIHIYDPSTPIFKAYKDIFNHWDELYKISIMNQKRGHKFDALFASVNKLIHHYGSRKA